MADRTFSANEVSQPDQTPMAALPVLNRLGVGPSGGIMAKRSSRSRM
jgi:hypothetical protein